MKKKKKHNVAYVLLIGTSAVLFWRGTWGLMDLYVFPDNHLLSYVVSLVSGVVILIASDRISDHLF